MTQASSFLLSLLSFTILGLALLGHHAHALPSSSNPLGSPAGSGRFRVGGLGALSHRPFVQNRKRATVCNGDASLCSRLYSNVTYIGAHNSYAIGSTRLVTVNQEQSVTTQLNDGIRMLQAQAHKSTNSTPTGAGIDLCHSDCALQQGGSLENYLSQVVSWVDSNPNEVLTLLFVNSDGLPATTWAQAFESTGLSKKVYSPPSGTLAKSSWPTLGQLIDAGTTVVAFLASEADTSTVPYLLPEFTNMWENAYDQTSVPFDCSVDRINSGTSPEGIMYLVNHFLDNETNLLGTTIYTPAVDQLLTTNSYESIKANVDNCANLHASYPTFILVDFYDYGNGSVFEAAARMNGVSYTAKPIGNSTHSSSSSSSSSSSHANPTLRGGTSSLLALIPAGLVTSAFFLLL